MLFEMLRQTEINTFLGFFCIYSIIQVVKMHAKSINKHNALLVVSNAFPDYKMNRDGKYIK